MDSSNYDCPKNNFRPHVLYIQSSLQSLESKYKKISKTIEEVHEESYDVPRPTNFNLLKTLSTNAFDSFNTKSLADILNYDIPQNTFHTEKRKFSGHPNQQYLKVSKFLIGNNVTSRQEFQGSLLPVVSNSTDLNLEAFLSFNVIAKLEVDTIESANRFLGLISSKYLPENFETVLINIKLSINCLRSTLHNFANFVERVYGTGKMFENCYLASVMNHYIKTLRHAQTLLNKFLDTISLQENHSFENLEDKRINEFISQKSIDELIVCIKTLIEDVHKVSSLIQKRSWFEFNNSNDGKYDELKPSSDNLKSFNDSSNPYGDYKFDSNSSLPFFHRYGAKKKNKVVANSTAMSNEMMQVFNRNDLKSRDKVLIRYYAVRTSTLMGNLRQAIDSFLETVESNQPPKVFIAYAKLVIINVYNLITMADMIFRQISKLKFHERMSDCTSILLDTLKIYLNKSKIAAAYFPSITVVQEMVDSVVDVSLLATDLKTIMLQAVYLKCL